MTTHETLRLRADDPDARACIDAAVLGLLASGPAGPRLRVELEGETLTPATIAALIGGLRRLREHGGALAVAPVARPVADALAIAGLDRVFAFPLESRERPLVRRRTRAAVAALTAAFSVAVVPAIAQDARPTDPSAIVAKVVERNPDLASYQGRVHVDMRMTTFPFYRTNLNGTTYYKKPSNYEVVFDRVPAIARGFDKIFADVGDPAAWEKRFVMTYEGETDYNGRKDVRLKLVQRVRGMIDHETVLVDPHGWTIDQIRYDYYNGGHITLSQTFREISGHSLLAEQNAEIAIPFGKAWVHGTYDGYKMNVAVDDAVFKKGQGQ